MIQTLEWWCDVLTLTREVDGYPCSESLTYSLSELQCQQKVPTTRDWSRRSVTTLYHLPSTLRLPLGTPFGVGTETGVESVHTGGPSDLSPG